MAGLVHAAVEPTPRGVRGEGNYIRINALDAENIVRPLLYQRRAFLNQRVSHASEVRSLAQRSSTAAKEIKELIGASVQTIQNGSALAGEGGKTMSDVTQAVARIDIIGETAAASAEQSRGIDQVNLIITQIDATTQQNAALVEQAAAPSKSLETQGRELSQTVSPFRMPAGEAATSAHTRTQAAGSASHWQTATV